MDLATAAAQLYALVPDEFTGARNEQAKAARDEGDRELSERIRRFRRPSTAAWVVNMLARHDSGTLEEIVELGTAMRQAQQDQDGDALRELNRRRREVLTAALREARELAADRGQRVSDSVTREVEQSLWAAMTDADAAAAVRSGQLVTALTTTGLGPVDVEGAVAVPSAVQPVDEGRGAKARTSKRAGTGGRKETTPARKPSDRARRQAQQKAAEAERALAEADQRLTDAQQQAEETRSRREGLDTELEDLRNRLRWTQKQVERTDRELAKAEKERDQAERRTESARAAAERARQRLARVDDDGS